jgi:hypothetical protein
LSESLLVLLLLLLVLLVLLVVLQLLPSTEAQLFPYYSQLLLLLV